MDEILKNDALTVKIASKGAEIQSVQDVNGIEYMWDGNPDYWKRHAPILFPIVGRLQNDQYNYEGQVYKMYQHGFARDNEFEVAEKTDSKVVFLLASNPDIKEHYPFDFKLYVTYELVGTTIKVSMLVKNEDKHSMYFSIGAHPGFKVPLQPQDGNFDDYIVAIFPDEDYSIIKLDKDGLTEEDTAKFPDIYNPLPITHDLFQHDAVIFDVEDNPSTTFKLISTKTGHGVAVTAYNNQYFGVWSTYPKESGFVCLEPWWGIADSEHSTGFIKDKNDISRLHCHEDFEAKFDIRYF